MDARSGSGEMECIAEVEVLESSLESEDAKGWNGP